ncbi:MAG: hypothetical protein DA446_08875 [Bacteroidetes bacterium]|nr:MAG: hypothetical protein DA446_08875 [Bacteroidota bacterium]
MGDHRGDEEAEAIVHFAGDREGEAEVEAVAEVVTGFDKVEGGGCDAERGHETNRNGSGAAGGLANEGIAGVEIDHFAGAGTSEAGGQAVSEAIFDAKADVGAVVHAPEVFDTAAHFAKGVHDGVVEFTGCEGLCGVEVDVFGRHESEAYGRVRVGSFAGELGGSLVWGDESQG